MDDLPELPFEKVLSYLSLEDRLKLSAVSRSCHKKIDNCRVTSLCYSERPSGLVWGKSRWISGAFAQNFVSSIRFEPFFNAFAQSPIFSNLKHLRLCDLSLDLEKQTAFSCTLNSFGQLEELDIIRAKCDTKRVFKLNLSMLISIQLEDLSGIVKLTLDAPRLRKVKLVNCSPPRLNLVHGESVERLITDNSGNIAVKNLRNLKYFFLKNIRTSLDSTFLSSLSQLKEIHLRNRPTVSELFEQKQRYGRADLKIFFWGCLLYGPDDPAISSLPFFGFVSENFARLAENPSRLADEIPFCDVLTYWLIERVPPELAINVLYQFTDLSDLIVNIQPVQDIERFLNLLKNFSNIVKLEFWYDQPVLFDRLSEHCAVQRLVIRCEVSDFQFLFRLNHLIELAVCCRFDGELIRKVFEELPFLSRFEFNYLSKSVAVEIGHPRQFRVLLYENVTSISSVSDLNAAIQFITESMQVKKRKADELLD